MRTTRTILLAVALGTVLPLFQPAQAEENSAGAAAAPGEKSEAAGGLQLLLEKKEFFPWSSKPS